MVKRFFLAVAIIIACLLIYYQFDEDLSPDVIRTLNYVPDKIPVKENAFYYLLGLYTDRNSLPLDKGFEILNAAEKHYSKDNTGTVFFVSDLPNSNVLAPNMLKHEICYSNEQPCLEDAKNNETLYLQVIEKNRVILDRLQHLYQFDKYKEPKYPLALNDAVKLQKIALAQVAIMWNKGDRSNALEFLTRNANFWRMVSRSEISLINRMISIANIRFNYNLLSEIVVACHGCVELSDHLPEILTPITKQELSMRKTMDYEYRYTYALFEKEYKKERDNNGEEIFEALLFKKNSFHNKMYSMYSRFILLSECEVKLYPKCHENFVKKTKERNGFVSLEFIDDPVSYILVEIAIPAYENYGSQYFSFVGKSRLIRVQHHLYVNKVKKSDYQAYLSNLPDKLKSPFNGKPITWNTGKNELNIDFRDITGENIIVRM